MSTTSALTRTSAWCGCARTTTARRVTLTRADVSPTNNLAERDLRRLVIWKKTSFGTGSVRGDRFAERMLSVVMTCRKQARSFFHYVADVVGGADAKLLPSG